jgi:hypothetical protein
MSHPLQVLGYAQTGKLGGGVQGLSQEPDRFVGADARKGAGRDGPNRLVFVGEQLAQRSHGFFSTEVTEALRRPGPTPTSLGAQGAEVLVHEAQILGQPHQVRPPGTPQEDHTLDNQPRKKKISLPGPQQREFWLILAGKNEGFEGGFYPPVMALIPGDL